MRLSSHHGSTLIELVMALALTALIVIAVTGLITRQQRLYRALDDALQSLPQRHDASALLGADIRTMTTLVTPSATASDTAFDIAATIGASTTCARNGSARIWLPPRATDISSTLTAWLTLPDSTDEVLIYRDRSTTPFWESHAIADLQTRGSAVCTGLSGAFFDAIASAAPAYEVILTAPIADSIPPGTPIRFVRYGRYNIYRASDASWYIGYRHCTSSHNCDGVQPLVGPLAKSTTAPAAFRFYMADGSRISTGASLSNLARVDIVVRHPSLVIPGLIASAPASNSDSTITSFALRNHQ